MIGALAVACGVWILAYLVLGWLLLLSVPSFGRKWAIRFIEGTGLDFQNRPLSVIALGVAVIAIGWGVVWITGRLAMGARKG